LWEFLEFPPELALPLETALGDLVYLNLVVEEAQIPGLLENLRQNRDQAAAFLAVNRQDREGPGELRSGDAPGVVGALLDKVKCRPEVTGLLRILLGEALLLQSLDSALTLHHDMENCGEVPPLLVTLQGEMINSQGIVTGSRENPSLPCCAEELSQADKDQNTLFHQVEDKKLRVVSLTQKELENQKLHKLEIELAQVNTRLSEQENSARAIGLDLSKVAWENLSPVNREVLQKEKDKWHVFFSIISPRSTWEHRKLISGLNPALTNLTEKLPTWKKAWNF